MERYGALAATVLRSETEWQQLQGFPLARNIARGGSASVRPELRALALADEKLRAAGLLAAGGAWGDAVWSRAYPLRGLPPSFGSALHLEVDMTNFDAVLARQLSGKAALV